MIRRKREKQKNLITVDTEKKYWVCLNLLNLPPLKTKELLTYFGTAEKILQATNQALLSAGFPKKDVEEIRRWEKLPWEEEIQQATEKGIEIITLSDENYPALLREIPNPPLVLYTSGKFAVRDNLSLGIVGTRHPSLYGIKMAEKFSRELASLGFTIISGLARGVDTQVHRSALKAGGRTIGVLGSGFCHFYPEENQELGKKITGQGAVISEFPLHTRPFRENFPRRNRIISGLSRGILVIEAGPQSGALITARYALEQNREVFALPGQIDSLTATGTNFLLKQGAKLVETVSDILEELNLEIKKKPTKETSPRPGLSQAEKQILESIGERSHIEEIITKSGQSPMEITRIIFDLELKGLIQSLPGKFYQRLR